jgi:hypothetical protein
MIVVVISVVLSLVLSVDVVDVSLGGGGGGAATPGESIIPASAEVASAAVRIVTAHVRRSLFTVLYLPEKIQKFLYEARRRVSFLARVKESALNLLRSWETPFPCIHCKRAIRA